MRVLVTGGREFSNHAALFRVLDEIRAHTPIVVIIHGASRGADNIAQAWASDNVVDELVYNADWTRGPRGGPERNQRMVSESRPDLAVVCPGGRGTADCVRRLKKSGVPIVEVTP